MNDYSDYIAYLKYEGSSVEEGFLDARKAANALLGFDESIRFYLLKEGVTDDFEIPVRIRRGSWEALIPKTLMDWVLTAGGAGATTYVVTAAAQMAKNDFEKISLGELIQKIVHRLQRLIKISKHVEGKSASEIKGVVTSGHTIILSGRNNSRLEITKAELEEYEAFPPKLISKMASVVEDNRVLKLGVVENGQPTEEEVTTSDKGYFYKEKEQEDEEILPELKDGTIVEIEGMLTRGNKRTNSLGLEYRGYVLTCRPQHGTVETYKPFLFTRCMVRGIVDRTTARNERERKPHLIIMQITETEESKGPSSMFDTK